MKQYFKSFVHNVFVHPLMMFMPTNMAHKWHDRNANWAFSLDRADELYLEGEKDK